MLDMLWCTCGLYLFMMSWLNARHVVVYLWVILVYDELIECSTCRGVLVGYTCLWWVDWMLDMSWCTCGLYLFMMSWLNARHVVVYLWVILVDDELIECSTCRGVLVGYTCWWWVDRMLDMLWCTCGLYLLMMSWLNARHVVVYLWVILVDDELIECSTCRGVLVGYTCLWWVDWMLDMSWCTCGLYLLMMSWLNARHVVVYMRVMLQCIQWHVFVHKTLLKSSEYILLASQRKNLFFTMLKSHMSWGADLDSLEGNKFCTNFPEVNKSKGQVNIYGLLNFMRDTYGNEKYASKMNLKLELFENKWNLWKDFL